MRRLFNIPIRYDHKEKCYKRGAKVIKGPYKEPRNNEYKMGLEILEGRFQEVLADPANPNYELVQRFNIARDSFTFNNPFKEVRDLK